MSAERIIAACSKVQAKGFRVEAGTWGIGWDPAREKWAPFKRASKRLCPLGALVLTEQPPPGRYRTVPEAVVKLLGVDMHWVIDFQCAFDGVADGVGPGAVAAATVFRSLAEQPSADVPQASAAKGEAGA